MTSRSRWRNIAGTSASVPVTLFGLILVTFLIGRVMPIDPIIAIVGDHAPPDVVARVRLELGLDRPLVVQFGIYLARLLHGNLGNSVMTTHPVTQDIATYFPATFELATAAIILAIVIGIPLGVIAAAGRARASTTWCASSAWPGNPSRSSCSGCCSCCCSTSSWDRPRNRAGRCRLRRMVDRITGMLVVDCGHRGPVGRVLGRAAPPRHAGYHPRLFQPGLHHANDARLHAGCTGRRIYRHRARQGPLAGARILWRHAFGNIAVPLVTVFALAYAGLLEGAVLTETVFSWPGLGLYLTVSLLNADMNAVLGATLVIGFIYVVLNLWPTSRTACWTPG